MGIYTEEKGKYQIDLSKAVWSTDELTKLLNGAEITQQMSSVDWIGETDDKILLIEYKNYEEFKEFGKEIVPDEFVTKMVKKYYGTALYALSLQKNKPLYYIGIIESSMMTNSKAKGILETKIMNKLPFKVQEKSSIPASMIADFKILTISEWNGEHPDFPLTRCVG